jgi:hypothetical protein
MHVVLEILALIPSWRATEVMVVLRVFLPYMRGPGVLTYLV